MSKHTQGPWKRDRWSIFGNDGSMVAKILPWDVSGCRSEDHANANLIAAAPDLLEALKDEFKFWQDCHHADWFPCRAEWAEKAQTAIAKAQGEL